MFKDDLFNYLVATDQLDEFLGYEEKSINQKDSESIEENNDDNDDFEIEENTQDIEKNDKKLNTDEN